MQELSSTWDFWARRYDRLWVQRVILGPSRQLVHERMLALGIRPHRLLDVGCGTGQFAEEVAERHPSCNVIACDTSQAMLARARTRCHGRRVSLIEGPLTDLRSEAPFDVITCMNALPYLPDQPAAIRMMRGMLRENGHLFVINATTASLYDRVVLSIFKLLVGRAHYPSAATVREHMSRAGFVDIARTRVSTPVWIPAITLVEGRRPT